MGNEQTKTNPLGIPDSYFKSFRMNPERTVLFFKVGSLDANGRVLVDIDIFSRDDTITLNLLRNEIPGFECGYYFYVKNQDYIRVQNASHLKELFHAYNVEIPTKVKEAYKLT